jgi:hypothetical protein
MSLSPGLNVVVQDTRCMMQTFTIDDKPRFLHGMKHCGEVKRAGELREPGRREE